MAGNAIGRLQMILRKRVEKNGFDRLFDKVKVLSAEPDKCTCEMLICKEHENVNGFLHGGMTASLVDSISTILLLASEKQVSGASINMNISFLRPVKSGEEILIEAKILQTGKTLAYSTVDILNKQTRKLIATAHHTKYIG